MPDGPTAATEVFHVIRSGVVYELTREPQGGYTISVPALPGCFSFGDTIDEALAKISEAMDLWLEFAREKDLHIPSQFDLATA